MKIECDWCMASAGVAGIVQCVLGSLGSHRICRGLWGYSVCTMVTDKELKI